MEKHIISIQFIAHITPDVIQIRATKPQGYEFKPGQATDVSINKSNWQNEMRPFTFTSLPHDEYLEFTIKTYPEHEGLTNELLSLKVFDELIVHEVYGSILYTRPGVFIAGGAGVTPFISIIRDLSSKNHIANNMLLFANKTKQDIILENELEYLLGKAFKNTLSDEQIDGYAHGFITEEFIKANVHDFNQQFYICGPPAMLEAVEVLLHHLGVHKHNITQEKFN
jgi:ferredoxin-NADP reductase